MGITYAGDEQAYEEYVRDELRLVGERLETGRKLRAARDRLIVDLYALGHTQTEVARIARIDQSVVSRVITAHRRANLLRGGQQTMQDGTTEGEPTMTVNTSNAAADEAKRTHERAEREFNRVINNTSDPHRIRAAAATLKETYHSWRTLQGA